MNLFCYEFINVNGFYVKSLFKKDTDKKKID